jgi:hypothetical protein
MAALPPPFHWQGDAKGEGDGSDGSREWSWGGSCGGLNRCQFRRALKPTTEQANEKTRSFRDE